MKTFFLQFFTWWNGQTLGTRFHTWRHGKPVGRDEQGNAYYEGGTDSEGRTRRWVIYNGVADASRIPPGWHGWMHHRVDTAPSHENYQPREWQKPHQANLTGTSRRLPAQGLGCVQCAPPAGDRRLRRLDARRLSLLRDPELRPKSDVSPQLPFNRLLTMARR